MNDMTTPTMRRGTVRRGDRIGAVLAGAAVSAAILETLLVTAWILTRPPCPPGYARLLDVAPLTIVWAVLTALPSFGLLVGAFRIRAGSRTWPLRGAAIVLLLLALPLSLLIGLELATVTGQEYDPGCWTF